MWMLISQLAKIIKFVKNMKIAYTHTLQWNPILHKPRRAYDQYFGRCLLYSLLETEGSYMYVVYFNYTYMYLHASKFQLYIFHLMLQNTAVYLSVSLPHTKIKAFALVVSVVSQLYV